MTDALEVWAVAQGDDVLVVSALCAAHARASAAALPIGLHVFQVKARAWIRRVLQERTRCSECEIQCGHPLRIVGAGATVRRTDLAIAGGEA